MPDISENPFELIQTLQDEAKALLARFPTDTNPNRSSFYSNIRKQEAKLRIEIKDWNNDFGKNRYGHGVSKSAIDGYIKSLKEICNKDITTIVGQNVIEVLAKQFQRTIGIAKECIEDIDVFLKLKRNPSQRVKPKNDMAGCHWNVYFLYYRDGVDTREPLLGRATVSIDMEDVVTFKNINLDESEDYQGYYIADNDMANGITSFYLESDDKGRRLHMKVFCSTGPKQKILIGQYNSFVNSRILTGNILFERVDSESELKPVGAFSFVENADEFKLIDENIRNFLALRHESYHQVFEKVDSLDKLKSKIDNYYFFKHKQSLFLEKPIPEVMVAAPNSSSTSQNNDEFLNRVINDLSAKLPLKFTAEKIYDAKNRPLPLENLKLLKTKRFFILIMPDVNKLSFSHVQLGLSIAYCKSVIIVCKKDDISKTILELGSQGLLKLIFIVSSLEEEWEDIAGRISVELKNNLPENLDGIMNTEYSVIH